MINCNTCGNETTKPKYCSPSCAGKAAHKDRIIQINHCASCKKDTYNPKYCSRSCAVIHTNQSSPKRKLTKKCLMDDCPIKIRSSLSFCKDHKYGGAKPATVGEIRKSAKYQVNAHLRWMARNWARKNIDVSRCWYCGYSNHIEICHIHPLADFTNETLIQDTFENNLVPLCPNHHWEFDNGILKYEPETGFEPA